MNYMRLSNNASHVTSPTSVSGTSRSYPTTSVLESRHVPDACVMTPYTRHGSDIPMPWTASPQPPLLPHDANTVGVGTTTVGTTFTSTPAQSSDMAPTRGSATLPSAYNAQCIPNDYYMLYPSDTNNKSDTPMPHMPLGHHMVTRSSDNHLSIDSSILSNAGNNSSNQSNNNGDNSSRILVTMDGNIAPCLDARASSGGSITAVAPPMGSTTPGMITVNGPDTPSSNAGNGDSIPILTPGTKRHWGMGRKKIEIRYIEKKLKRQITFSKRKSGMMKKIHELVTLTGAQGLLVLVSETGHVYSYATSKLSKLVADERTSVIKQALEGCGHGSVPGTGSPPPSEYAVSGPNTTLDPAGNSMPNVSPYRSSIPHATVTTVKFDGCGY